MKKRPTISWPTAAVLLGTLALLALVWWTAPDHRGDILLGIGSAGGVLLAIMRAVVSSEDVPPDPPADGGAGTSDGPPTRPRRPTMTLPPAARSETVRRVETLVREAGLMVVRSDDFDDVTMLHVTLGGTSPSRGYASIDVDDTDVIVGVSVGNDVWIEDSADLPSALARVRSALEYRGESYRGVATSALLVAALFLTGCGAGALRTHSTVATIARVSVVTAGDAIARSCEAALVACSDGACVDRVGADCRIAATAQGAALASVRAYVDVIEVAALADEGQVAASLDVAVQAMARVYEALREALAAHPSLGVTLPPLPPIALALLRALASQVVPGASS